MVNSPSRAGSRSRPWWQRRRSGTAPPAWPRTRPACGRVARFASLRSRRSRSPGRDWNRSRCGRAGAARSRPAPPRWRAAFRRPHGPAAPAPAGRAAAGTLRPRCEAHRSSPRCPRRRRRRSARFRAPARGRRLLRGPASVPPSAPTRAIDADAGSTSPGHPVEQAPVGAEGGLSSAGQGFLVGAVKMALDHRPAGFRVLCVEALVEAEVRVALSIADPVVLGQPLALDPRDLWLAALDRVQAHQRGQVAVRPPPGGGQLAKSCDRLGGVAVLARVVGQLLAAQLARGPAQVERVAKDVPAGPGVFDSLPHRHQVVSLRDRCRSGQDTGVRPGRSDIAAPDLPPQIEWVGQRPAPMLRLAGHGPVLVHFFDFAQLNSVRALPYVREWHRRYANEGLSVVGVQAPRFAFGSDPAAVRRGLERLAVEYPVAIDAEREMWLGPGGGGRPRPFLWGRRGG